MKISAINIGVRPTVKNNNYYNTYNQIPFGLDCDDEDYLRATNYEHKEGGNVFTFFKLLGQLVSALIKENFCEVDYTSQNFPILDDGDSPETPSDKNSDDPSADEVDNSVVDIDVSDVDDDEDVDPSNNIDYSNFNFNDDIL